MVISPTKRLSKVAAIAVVIVALFTTACSGGSTSTTTTQPPSVIPKVLASVTPPGWSPVSFGDVQISVPSSWEIEQNGGLICGPVGGMVFLEESENVLAEGHCTAPPTEVSIATMSPHEVLPAGRYITVNGVPVLDVSHVSSGETYYIPTLGASMTATGPLATEVLHTLTHSPYSVVMAAPRSMTAPPTWQRVTFGGIRISVPRSWKQQHVRVDGCWVKITPDVIELNSAQVSSRDWRCPAPPLTAGWLAAQFGIHVISGKYAGDYMSDLTISQTRSVNGLSLGVSTESEKGGILYATVQPPGKSSPTVIQLGLAALRK